MTFEILVALAGVLAGGIASVSGFGIGSLLTPVFALQVGTKVAVAAVSIPHFVGTAQRLWILRRRIDREILLGFGLASALGGLAGALLHARTSSRALTIVFGLLLLLAGLSELTGMIARVRWGRRAAWIAGLVSGLFGGLVGNQGGTRAAALLGFDVPREAFIATATAVALIVDLVRMPVYVATEGAAVAQLLPAVLIATAGVVVGTAIGARVLTRMPEKRFRRSVAGLLVALGVYVLAGAASRGAP